MGFYKSIIRTVLAGTILSLFWTGSVFAAAKATVTGDNVNVRNQADANGAVLGSLNQGQEIDVLSKNGDWVQISYNGTNAFVSGQFINVNKIDAAINGEGVNIRSNPDTSSNVVAAASAGTSVTVTAKTGDFYQVSYNGTIAYVHKDYLAGDLLDLAETSSTAAAEAQAAETLYGIAVCDDVLNVRSEASTEAVIVEKLTNDTVVDVLGVSDKWVQIKTPSGNIGYASSDYLAVRKGEKPSRGNSSKGDQVIAYAKQFIGTPYVYGGTNLSSGVDCSGFVYSVMKNFGITLNRSSRDMVANGVPVEKSQLIAGDLVLFDTTGPNDGGISHVGIYIGNGQYIHSSSGKEWGVTISDLNNEYGLRTYVTARRVLR